MDTHTKLPLWIAAGCVSAAFLCQRRYTYHGDTEARGKSFTIFAISAILNLTMRRKKAKKKVFRAVTAVKALSRKVLGTVPTTRTGPVKKKEKTAKHKPTLGKMLGEE